MSATDIRLSREQVGRVIADIVRGPESKPFTTRAVWCWCRTGGLPFARFGGRQIFFRDQVEAWAMQKVRRSGTARIPDFPGGLIHRQQKPATPARAGISPRVKA